MTELLQFDEQLFHLINSQWQNNFFDFFLPLMRNKYIWAPLYLFVISFALINVKKGGYWVLMLLLCVTISDTMSSKVLKKSVQRIRPCNTERLQERIEVRVKCGGGYSFPSSHATNHFAVAIFFIITLGRRFRWIKLPLLLWAATIAVAQVYVGVHYPLDILCGTILGVGIGYVLGKGFLKLINRIEHFSWKY